MGEFSMVHWLVIGAVAIVFFGPKRLPALGQSLGESIRGFKKALNDHHDEQDDIARREKLQAQAAQAQAKDVEHTSTKS